MSPQQQGEIVPCSSHKGQHEQYGNRSNKKVAQPSTCDIYTPGYSTLLQRVRHTTLSTCQHTRRAAFCTGTALSCALLWWTAAQAV
jgi:hypothetical protein